MNILILNWKDIKNPTSGGAEIVTYEHAKRWIQNGNKVTWLASEFKGSAREELIDGINIRRFGSIYSIYLYAPFFYLFSGNKFDVVVDEVHGIPFFTPFYVRKPVLVLIHEIAGDIWDLMYRFPLNYLGKMLEKIYLKLYSGKIFWTDSKATIDELVTYGINKKNCKSIPCPSNAPVLLEIPKKNKNLTIVSVSRIVKMKGIEDVLAAFFLISKKNKDAKLLIIGGGEKSYVNYLKEMIVKHKLGKSVEFLGYIDEKEKIETIKKSHLLLHASIKEGWGIVVIEAASQATPSVVYNVPGLSESVKNNVTGIVIKENNPKTLAEEVLRVIEDIDLYKKLQLGSLKWAKSLNWEKSTSESLNLLNIVLRK